MPERRSLRSSKPESSSSSTNGDKARSNSQSSGSNKDKPQPTRSTSSRSKSFSSKKGITSAAKDTNGDQNHINGTNPVENGVDGSNDPELDEKQNNSTSIKKSGKEKDVDEEMTVVVPPSKVIKADEVTEKDDEGDIAMNGAEDAGSKVEDDPVDPQANAAEGMCILSTTRQLYLLL